MLCFFRPVGTTDFPPQANDFLKLRVVRKSPGMLQVPRLAVCGGLRREHPSELGNFPFHERQTVGNRIELKCFLCH